MRNLKEYGNQCIDEMVLMGIDVDNLPMIEWTVSNRSKRRYGQCRYKINEGECEINISSFLLDENITPNEDSLKNTIIHELVHALNPGEGHKGKWKDMADYITKASNGRYKIKRCTSYEEKGVDRDKLDIPIYRSLKPKYIVECQSCGGRITRTKRTKVVQKPWLYRCSRCKGSLRVLNLS